MALTRTPSRVLSLLAGAALIGASVLVLPHLAGADPGQPSVGEVTAKLDKLSRQDEVLTEKFNKATIEVAAKQKAADAAQKAALAAATGFDKARSPAQPDGNRAIRIVVVQSCRCTADQPERAELSRHPEHAEPDLGAPRGGPGRDHGCPCQGGGGAEDSEQAARPTRKPQRNDLDKQKRQVQKQTEEVHGSAQQVDRAQQRNTYADSNSVPPASVHPGSGGSAKAQIAVNFAIAQVGKSYVFAAAGPDAFDCSGLTMAAWAQAGVSLPHLASAQYNYGQSVSYDQLQPGDLIFLYSPISHVEIYIGNDIAVSAADEELGIRYVHVSQDMGDWAGAKRIG